MQELQKLPGQYLTGLTLLIAVLAGAGCSHDELPPQTIPTYDRRQLELPSEPTPTAPTKPTAAATKISRQIQGSLNAPNPNSVIDLMHFVADWQLDNPTTDAKNGWIYAPFYSGVVALGRLEKDSKYLDLMMKQGAALRWQLDNNLYDADHHAISQLYLDLYALKQQPDAIAQEVKGTSMDGTYYILKVACGKYSCVHDEVKLGESEVRRLTLTLL